MAPLNLILVATDLSTPARHAAQRAALLAQQIGARLDLIHVAPQAPIARLQELADLLAQEHGVHAGVKTAEGELLPTLQAEAAAQQCGLIVLGHRGESVLRHLLMGSTAERMLSSATRPMLVVKQAPLTAYRNVLIAVDLSPASVRAIHLARAVAPGARLCLLHAFDLPFEGSLRYAGVSTGEIDQYRMSAHAQAERQLNALAQSAGLAPNEALTVVQHGDASVRIAEQAQALGTDLIVMGKHADGVLERLFLDSVTKRVLSDTEVDVLVSV